jgi:hypothetical protein
VRHNLVAPVLVAVRVVGIGHVPLGHWHPCMLLRHRYVGQFFPQGQRLSLLRPRPTVQRAALLALCCGLQLCLPSSLRAALRRLGTARPRQVCED